MLASTYGFENLDCIGIWLGENSSVSIIFLYYTLDKQNFAIFWLHDKTCIIALMNELDVKI